MEYTETVKKLITKNFKDSEAFYKERDKQIEIAKQKIEKYNEMIKKKEEEKEQYEKTVSQLRIF